VSISTVNGVVDVFSTRCKAMMLNDGECRSMMVRADVDDGTSCGAAVTDDGILLLL
jgi:hypothetical protein